MRGEIDFTPEDAQMVIMFEMDPALIDSQIQSILADRAREVYVRNVAAGQPASEAYVAIRGGRRM